MRIARVVTVFAALMAGTVWALPVTAGSTPAVAGSIEELDSWHSAIAPVLSIDGVNLTDADETTMTLLVGVEDLGITEQVLHTVSALGVPPTVVRVEQWDPIRIALDDRHRPMVGGLQIQFQSGFLGLSTGTCTAGFGFASTSLNARGFITNSHCTRTRGELDNGRYWSPTRPASDGDQVGTEIKDPPFFTGGVCPAGRKCRYSDAAAVRTTAAADMNVGTIARPSLNSTSWAGQDVFRVYNEATPSTTMTATKVGRTTGRTQGPVTHTCANTNVADSDITMLCQNFVRATVDPGDSGSPVFQITNSPSANNVALLGVLWGETTSGGYEYFCFSSMSRIKQEIGSMNTWFGS